MSKLKKAKSSKKLSFSDVGLEPKPIFELDDLSYKQRRKIKKNSINSDDNENENFEKETKLMTKSELKKAEKKRKSLNKNKNKSEEEKSTTLTENDELKMIRELSKKMVANSNNFKSLIKDGNDDKEVKTNSFLSLEDSFRSVSEYNNSSFDTDSSESSSSSDNDELLDIVEEKHEEIINNLKQDNVVIDLTKPEEKIDTYENLFDEILDDKIKKEKELTPKKNDINDQFINDIKKNDDVVKDKKHGNLLEIVNSSLDDMDLSTKKEENHDSIQEVSKSESSSPKKFSKRKMLYNFANSVWDYVKPVSLDELERKQSESKTIEGESKNKDNDESELLKSHIEEVELNTKEINNSNVKLEENKTFENNNESLDEKVELNKVEDLKRSKSQEIISHLNNYGNINDQEILMNTSTKLSNSHNGSLVSTPIRKSKRQIIYNFANSIWDYVKPVSLDELEERRKTNNDLNVDSNQPIDELKKSSFLNDEVSDSEFYIHDTEEEEDNKEEKNEFVLYSEINKEENVDIKQDVDCFEKEKNNDKNQLPLNVIHGKMKKETNIEEIHLPLVETLSEEGNKDHTSVTLQEDNEKEIIEENKQSQTNIINPELQVNSLDSELELNPVEKLEIDKEEDLKENKEEETEKEENLDKKDGMENGEELEGEKEELEKRNDLENEKGELKNKEEDLENKEEPEKNNDMEDKKEDQESKVEEQENKEELEDEKEYQENKEKELEEKETENQNSKEDEQNYLNIVSNSNYSEDQQKEVDQINFETNHLDEILENIATDSNTIMEELSHISIANKQDHTNIIQIPDLSEISLIQEIIDSNRLNIFHGTIEKPPDQEHIEINHEIQASMESSLNEYNSIINKEEEEKEEEETHLLHQNHFDTTQTMVERMEDEILNTNLNIDEYNELFNNLHTHANLNSDEYNMNSLENQAEEKDTHFNFQLQQDLHKDHPHLYQQVSIQEIDDSLFMSISSDKFLFENTMLISEKQVKNQHGMVGYSFQALECCSGKNDHPNISSEFISEALKTQHSRSKVNKIKQFNKLYRINNKLNKKFREINNKISIFNQEESYTKKDIDLKVKFDDIQPDSSNYINERPSLNKEEGYIVIEEILPTHEIFNPKIFLDASVNTEIIPKFNNNYQEKGVNTHFEHIKEDQNQSTSSQVPETTNFLEKDKKVDSIFRNEIYKILDNTRLVKKAQRLKSGYANNDQVEIETDHNFKNSTSSNIKYNRERYIKPGNNRYDIITQETSRRYIKDYPESNSEESIKVFSPKNNYNIPKNSQVIIENTPKYNYEYEDYNHISPKSLEPINNTKNYYSYYLGSNSNSPTSNNYSNIRDFSNISNSNSNNVNTSSYYYNGGDNHTQIKYPEYFIKPNNKYVNELGRSNYHVNYYCGKSGGSEEVKRYMYVEGLTNKNQGSFYFYPPGQARN
ncbi:hypothetical protein CPHLJ_5g2250 [Cryptosporidium parvum]